MTETPNPTGVDPARLRRVASRERNAFERRCLKSAAWLDRAGGSMPNGVPMQWMAGLYRHISPVIADGTGPRFTDIDGNTYLDFNLADLSNVVGFGETPVSRAVRRCANVLQTLLPTEDATAVSDHLASRTGLPGWQFTLSASGAIEEVLRIARAYTKRDGIIVFEGRYHGHGETTLADADYVGGQGLSAGAGRSTRAVCFNDLDALEAALAIDPPALVLVEPALTNCALVLPEEDFLLRLLEQSRAAGALVAYDETHTWHMRFGGYVGGTREKPDMVVLGKGLGSGVPLGTYGLSDVLLGFVTDNLDVDIGDAPGLALGGTTYANPLSLAAARAMLEDVATRDAQDRVDLFGARLASGLQSQIAARGLPWQPFHLGPRSGLCLTPRLPLNASEAALSIHRAFLDARKVFFANRGIWDAIATAGPQAGFAHAETDIDAYLAVSDAFLDEVVS